MSSFARFLLSTALTVLCACDAPTDPFRKNLSLAPVVLQNQPTAGQVTFAVDVENISDSDVYVSTGCSAVGYRLVARTSGTVYKEDPRQVICGLLPGTFAQTLMPGESARIFRNPPAVGDLVAGVYDLTVLVYLNKRYYRELPVGEFTIP
jgi:hypothetical protein